MAVGDDDQNIYSFRKTSVEFIRRFETDYEADKSYLVENFRSTQNIISAANTVIQRAPDRMKVDHPIRIDHARSRAPAGGRWAHLDPVAQGCVQLIRVPGATHPARYKTPSPLAGEGPRTPSPLAGEGRGEGGRRAFPFPRGSGPEHSLSPRGRGQG